MATGTRDFTQQLVPRTAACLKPSILACCGGALSAVVPVCRKAVVRSMMCLRQRGFWCILHIGELPRALRSQELMWSVWGYREENRSQAGPKRKERACEEPGGTEQDLLCKVTELIDPKSIRICLQGHSGQWKDLCVILFISIVSDIISLFFYLRNVQFPYSLLSWKAF